MKTITIEWRHLVVDDATCDRCADTGEMLRDLVVALNAECADQAVQIRFVETPLGAEQIAESNRVLIDGRSLETYVESAEAGQSCCGSCSDLTGKEEVCRTLDLEGERYEVPPASVIRDVIYRLAGSG